MYYNLITMQNYNEQHILTAEVAQLILLHHLYSQSGSHVLIFQGGTALRWCYGGSRFSEDLDFVFSGPLEKVDKVLAKALKNAEKEMLPHFGPGALTVTDKTVRSSSRKLMVSWQPEKVRRRIAIKLEFEPLSPQAIIATANLVFSTLPSVSYLINKGSFRIPRPNSVLVTETPAEILSDKVRALLERKYLKGRDFFDVWFLTGMLGVRLDQELVARKLAAYQWPFVAARGFDSFFAISEAQQAEMIKAIEQDLARFLPPQTIAVHRATGYRAFLDAVDGLFRQLRDAGVHLP
ncbi:MAG: hypothetical protein A2511_06605 [Deltaproteobacteria bacterium RIFOXYD12_FULL_50_9]|nr:MAG: hypothetical protein A2511_06605 [Deltaproteobacteria bacterium RIFOXYD12_FULL_50_9]